MRKEGDPRHTLAVIGLLIAGCGGDSEDSSSSSSAVEPGTETASPLASEEGEGTRAAGSGEEVESPQVSTSISGAGDDATIEGEEEESDGVLPQQHSADLGGSRTDLIPGVEVMSVEGVAVLIRTEGLEVSDDAAGGTAQVRIDSDSCLRVGDRVVIWPKESEEQVVALVQEVREGADVQATLVGGGASAPEPFPDVLVEACPSATKIWWAGALLIE